MRYNYRTISSVLAAVLFSSVALQARADEIPIEIVGQPDVTQGSEYAPVVDLDLANVPVEPHAYEGPADEQVLSPDDLSLLQPEGELTMPEGSAARAAAAGAAPLKKIRRSRTRHQFPPV